ncbi:hypothetical protein [Paraburkholderia silvatlantica]|uniref:hypothetical protein n=1 Tax=Paraburkholderia silvatlantica TaxID=321895 RepID=UPI0037536E1A
MNRQKTDSLALRVAHAHENERLREALVLIAEMAETSTSALSMTDIARLARAALAPSNPPNPALRTGA